MYTQTKNAWFIDVLHTLYIDDTYAVLYLDLDAFLYLDAFLST